MKKVILTIIIVIGISAVLIGVAAALRILPVDQSWSRSVNPSSQPPNPESRNKAQVPDPEETRYITTMVGDHALTVPDGVSVTLFAQNIGSPRDLVAAPHNAILASVPASGTVLALPDANDDNQADGAFPILQGLNKPHGLALECVGNDCLLYVAETNALARYRYIADTRKADQRTVLTRLATGGRHTTKSLVLLPGSEEILVSSGSSCDACNESNSERASIVAVHKQTGRLRPYATGLRNAVFMVSHPTSRDIWVTEMGRDWLGDNLPPDEINIIREGDNYGWPYCYGKNQHDTNFDSRQTESCQEPKYAPSYIDLPAHSAPLGLQFIPSHGWPKSYQGALLVAYHGSWNRSVPTGYKIALFKRIDQSYSTQGEDFATGWLTSRGDITGRPVDIEALTDGSLLISDDKSGVVYRIAYQNPL